jgi:hypothetical protein
VGELDTDNLLLAGQLQGKAGIFGDVAVYIPIRLDIVTGSCDLAEAQAGVAFTLTSGFHQYLSGPGFQYLFEGTKPLDAAQVSFAIDLLDL